MKDNWTLRDIKIVARYGRYPRFRHRVKPALRLLKMLAVLVFTGRADGSR